MRVARHVGIALCVSWIAAGAGCSTTDTKLGSISVNLVGQAQSGNVYRLRDAVITVTGDEPDRGFNTEDNPDQTTMSADVVPGAYLASVQPGWRLERIVDVTAVTVPAQLVSPNPLAFSVLPNQRTAVPLRFQVDADNIDLTQGYDIVVTVDETTPALLYVSNQGRDGASSTIASYPSNATGDVSPLRTISGPEMPLPMGLTIMDDQIIAGDAFNSINFYPLNANGNVPPSRRIVGSTSQLNDPSHVISFNNELYVAQINGVINVFPQSASGDVAPVRTMSFFSFSVSEIQFLAIDDGEIYASTVNDGKIIVAPVTASGPTAPTRIIIASGLSPTCPSGIAVADGELYTWDPCRQEIRVYPKTTSGDAAPSRVITSMGPSIGGTHQLTLFRGELYIATSNDQVLVFPSRASGAVLPTRTIAGSHTGLSDPFGVTVH